MALEARVPEPPEGGATAPSPGAPAGRPTAAAAGAIVLKERLEILPDQPLPELSTPWASAFSARDLLGMNDGLYALVISDVLPCREDVIPRMISARSRGLFDLIDFGTVMWTDGRRRLAIVSERPGGPALMPDLSAIMRPMPLAELVDKVLGPISEGLGNMALLGVTHRGIRPSNVFIRSGASREYALGDFLTGPPAAAQPAVFETVGSAMCLPSGRGPGTLAHDIFALGVTLLVLHLGRNPVAHMNDVELMAARLQSGSFSALLGTEPITGAFRDLLRGMLQDDPAQRWTIEDVVTWVRERRGRVFVVGRTERALRPLSLGGQNFYACRPLAAQLATKWRTASLVDKKEELVNWLARSIQETSYLTAVSRALDWRWAMGRKSFPGGMDAGLNARLCVALDRKAPVRYKSFSAYLDGIGPAIVSALGEPERLRDASEMLMQQLPEFAVELTTTEDDAEVERIVQRFRCAGRAFADNRPGQGIERALYELNPLYPCQSPIVIAQRVTEIADLLPALERIAGHGQVQGLPMDRHIAAFIASRFTFLSDDVFTLLAAPVGTTSHVFGVVGLIASVQAKLGPRALPRLAHWVAPSLKPVIDSFHRRATRQRLEAALPGVLDGGDFTRLQDFIIGADQRRRDRDEFQAAVREYAKLETEVRFIDSGGASSPQHAREYGHMMGAWLSVGFGLIAAAAAVALVL
jgi:hypothetical protein